MVTMLFAVEGGGFFSSSASGYSDGLTLLLLGRKNEERLMRVSPWNQYQLVEQDLDPDVQLASKTNRVSRRCASFVCFGRASAGLDGHSPPRVGPAQQSDSTDILSASEKDKICSQTDSGDENGWKVFLKSSLKKNPTDCAVAVHRDTDACETRDEERSDATGCIDRRKVQWTDACGRDLAEVREFEPSDEESSDDEFERDGVRRCHCVVQ
uniref:Phosphoribosylformylglycinamidine synthase 2 n=1 Tax=Anthurium amnicola TaxID=1678845 RepID=A0A1D1YP27_9ARAE